MSALALAGALTSFVVLKSSEDKSADNTFLQHAGDRATVLVWELQRVLGDLQVGDWDAQQLLQNGHVQLLIVLVDADRHRLYGSVI